MVVFHEKFYCIMRYSITDDCIILLINLVARVIVIQVRGHRLYIM